jgi:DNA-binding transcriptional regulator YiaG
VIIPGAQGILSPSEVAAIRKKLGWSHQELADGLALAGAYAADTVRQWEMEPDRKKAKPISGSAVMAMLAFLEGFVPPDDDEIEAILLKHGITPD